MILSKKIFIKRPYGIGKNKIDLVEVCLEKQNLDFIVSRKIFNTTLEKIIKKAGYSSLKEIENQKVLGKLVQNYFSKVKPNQKKIIGTFKDTAEASKFFVKTVSKLR